MAGRVGRKENERGWDAGKSGRESLECNGLLWKAFFPRVTYHRQIREEEPEEPLRIWQSESPHPPQSRR